MREDVRHASSPAKAARVGFAPAVQFWALQIAFPASGLGLLIAGHALGWPQLMSTGVLTLGAAAIASGAACALMRRITFARRGWGFELWVWHGVAAVFIGAALIVLGLALAMGAGLHLSGMELTTLSAGLRAHPGLVFVPLGLVLLASGIGAFIGFAEAGEANRGRLWNLILSIPDRIAGVILVLLGAAALALGAYELTEPDAFDQWIDAIARGAPGWPGMGTSP